jgi:hypothetical protein
MLVSVIKLISGEEIVAEVTLDEVNQVTLLNPLQLMLQQKQDGNGGLGTMILPWAVSVEGKIVISKDKTVYIAAPKQELVDQYNQIFGKVMAPRTPKILIKG